MIALCSKCYFIDDQGEKTKFSTKGMSKKQNEITWQRWKAARIWQQTGFRMRDGRMVTYEQQKLGLSAHYDKRWVLPDGIHITYKALNDLAPSYVRDLLTPYTPSRQLRSSSKEILSIPHFNLKTYGARSFSVAAPTLWNTLPSDIKNSSSVSLFKHKLKTFLFKKHFYNFLATFFIFILLVLRHFYNYFTIFNIFQVFLILLTVKRF